MSDVAAALVHEAIEDHGPIGFDEYMRIVLYGPGGFYETPPIGADEHFVTAPHVHPFAFAHCIRDALLEGWFALREPDPFPIVELGAGDGTLAEALVDAFAELPRPAPAYTAVEISRGARATLERRGIANVGSIDDLPPIEGAVIANELLDNLPFLVARGGHDGVREVRVGIDRGALVEIAVPWSRELEPPGIRAGEVSTVPIGALAMLDDLASRLSTGYVLLIDYPAGTGDVRGYRAHRAVADVLADPGEVDVTAGVDVEVIAAHARTVGLQAFEPVRQADALAALGLERWRRALREQQADLQRDGRDSAATRVWQTRSRASVLTDPAGLGRLWWLVLATDGLPPPAWLGRVADRRGVTRTS